MSRIVGIGAAVMDTLITVPSFPVEDTKMRADGVKAAGGGPAATAIVAASKLGIESGFIGTLSNDSGGKFLYDDFIKYGVDTSNITIAEGFRSFTSCIWLNAEKGTRTCVFDRGNIPALVLNESQKKAVSEADILMVDGNNLDAAIEGAKLAKTVLYDAGGLYPNVDKLLPLADILIPSAEFAMKHTETSDERSAAEKLFEMYNPRVVVVTCGKRGGIMYRDGIYTEYPIYPAEVVDSNGAGDVFHGAFAAGLVKGFSYEQCCHFSSAVSALKCMTTGARESVPDFDTTINYLRSNNYELQL